MKQFGWRGLAYVVIVCGTSAAVVVLAAIEGKRVDIDKDFYAAAAQVIPVLLLAIIVRISSQRDLLVASEKEIEGRQLELLSRISRLRESSESSDTERDEKLKAELDEIETRLSKSIQARKAGQRPDGTPAKMGETLTASLITTLILGAGGIGAALAALAFDPDSGALCIATAVSITWVLIGLVTEEVLHFLISGSLGSD